MRLYRKASRRGLVLSRACLVRETPTSYAAKSADVQPGELPTGRDRPAAHRGPATSTGARLNPRGGRFSV